MRIKKFGPYILKAHLLKRKPLTIDQELEDIRAKVRKRFKELSK